MAASRFLCQSCLLSRGTPTAGCMVGPTGWGALGSSTTAEGGRGKVTCYCAEVSTTHVGPRRHGNNPPLVCDSCVGVSVCSAAVGSCVTRPLWSHGRGQPLPRGSRPTLSLVPAPGSIQEDCRSQHHSQDYPVGAAMIPCGCGSPLR